MNGVVRKYICGCTWRLMVYVTKITLGCFTKLAMSFNTSVLRSASAKYKSLHPQEMFDILIELNVISPAPRPPGAEVIKLVINLILRLKQADWLILRIRSVSTNQHAWV